MFKKVISCFNTISSEIEYYGKQVKEHVNIKKFTPNKNFNTIVTIIHVPISTRTCITSVLYYLLSCYYFLFEECYGHSLFNTLSNTHSLIG